MSKKINIRQFICCVLVLLISFLCLGVFDNKETKTVNGDSDPTECGQKSLMIEKLNDERMQAILSGDSEKADNITNELKKYGVVQMTYGEMCGLFNVPVPMYEIEYDNYIYERFSDDFKWEGKVYSVMVINITPTNSTSKLWVGGSFTAKRVNKIAAGALAVLDVASFFIGQVKELKKVVTAYDFLQMIKDAVSRFDSTTMVENVEAAYMWSFAESCSFHYVPSAIGTTGWSLIGRFNKINGTISTSVLGLDYDSDTGEGIGSIDTYNYSVNIQADGFYNEAKTALNFYNGMGTTDNRTEYINIKGVDGSVIHKVKFLNPLYQNQVF